MQKLLLEMEITLPVSTAEASVPNPSLMEHDDSIFLADEYRRSSSVSISDFPDRTGLECFVNHVHLPFERNRRSLVRALAYVERLRKNLADYAKSRSFQIIMSVSGSDCVVRFHQCRFGEIWLATDLDKYLEESILTVSVGDIDGESCR